MIYNLTDNTFINDGEIANRSPIKLREYDNRLWGVCDDGAIVFSASGDATTWDNALRLPNWENPLDFIPVQGGVIIPHKHGAYALYGSGTYQDTSVVPIQCAAKEPPIFTDSAVTVDNVVFILGNTGISAITLNGIKELPHNQHSYFESLAPVWDATFGTVQGTYISRFHAILYLFQQGYSQQGFVYYLNTGAIFKINNSISDISPYMIGLNIPQVDFLLAKDDYKMYKSRYPSSSLLVNRSSAFQTRFEDFDSQREKVFSDLRITTKEHVNNTSVTIYLDYSNTGTIVHHALDLVKGENTIHLDGYDLRGKAISIRIDINAVVNAMKDEFSGHYLIDEETGQYIIDEGGPNVTADASFAIREVACRFYETGPLT